VRAMTDRAKIFTASVRFGILRDDRFVAPHGAIIKCYRSLIDQQRVVLEQCVHRGSVRATENPYVCE
jgi:hypothetical protein